MISNKNESSGSISPVEQTSSDNEVKQSNIKYVSIGVQVPELPDDFEDNEVNEKRDLINELIDANRKLTNELIEHFHKMTNKLIDSQGELLVSLRESNREMINEMKDNYEKQTDQLKEKFIFKKK